VRAVQEVPLRERAPEHPQLVPDLLRLDSLRDHGEPKIPTEIDRGADDGRVTRVLAHSHHERAVDLDGLHRKPLEVRER